MALVAEWRAGPEEVVCVVSGAVVFRDRRDHWEQGVLRLLGLTDAAGRAWVEDVVTQSQGPKGQRFDECSSEEKLELLASVTGRHFASRPSDGGPPPQSANHLTALGQPVDCQWVSHVRDRGDLAVAGSRALRHGILVERVPAGWSAVSEATYDESYFEGSVPGVGYGGYREQAGWRTEKAMTLLRRIRGIGASLGGRVDEGTRVLDVGSGYGYFRKAAEAVGWATSGVEISRHAIQVAEQEFGLRTFPGTLEEFAASRPGRFDVVTLFDTIEHVSDVFGLLRSALQLLTPQGLCVIRTPNLGALELGVFGGWYHSLKLEHVQYFSPESLTWALEQVGLVPAFLTSDAHLLQGFLGRALDRYARLLRGSDLFLVGQNPA